MPFKSKAQARYMFAKHPEIAKRFARETKSIKALPEHVGKEKKAMLSAFFDEIEKIAARA